MMDYILGLFSSILGRVVIASLIIYAILYGVNKCLDYRDGKRRFKKLNEQRYAKYDKSNFKGKSKPKIKKRR